MTFPEACGLVYSKGIISDIEKEKRIPAYLSQEAFAGDCMARGKALSLNAERRTDNFKAFVIALSREIKDGEDTQEQQAVLLAVMPEEDVFLAQEGVTVFRWWKD